MSPNQVPYKLNGRNLFEFRRTDLRKLALKLDIPAEGNTVHRQTASHWRTRRTD
jgi:hypothetical protein